MPQHARLPLLLVLTALLLGAALAPFTTGRSFAAAGAYYISPLGNDANSGTSPTSPFRSIQRAIDLAGPGASIMLAPGTYAQDLSSRRAGTPDAPITLSGPADAVLTGGGKARVIEINHSFLTLSGFTIDGQYQPGRFRDKLIYALGKQPRSGVSGLRLLGLTLRNAGGECVRLRYFARQNEIANTTIGPCGRDDFPHGAWAGGGKNGEGVYIGTAPEQRGDGKNPTSDPDQSNDNWLHHNRFDTQGNECVDIKEDAANNLVEDNYCTGQRDGEVRLVACGS